MIFSRHTTVASRMGRRAKRSAGVGLRVEGLEQRTVLSYLVPVTYPVGTGNAGVTVGKFNLDDAPDLAVVDQSTGTVNVLLGNPDGTYQPKVSYPAGTGAVDVKAGDFNGDGKADLAVAATSGSVNVLLGNGDGTFGAPSPNPVGLGAHSVVLGDFNDDGRLDVATMNSSSSSILLGNGDGTFATSLNTAIPGNSTNAVVGDYNRDGFLDLATSNTASLGTITLLRGHGDGSFDPAASIYAYSAPVSISSGDFNHDGYDDFAVANSYAATSMSVILNKGDGTYAPPTTYGIAETGYEIEVEDFNGDGNKDFAVRGGSRLMVHLGKGDGTFYPETSTPTPSGRFQAGGVGDLNGDGAVDFVYPSASGVTVVTNAADDLANVDRAVGFRVDLPASTTAGSSLPITITAVDASGQAVVGFKGTVFITSNDPASPSSLSYTFNAADAGVHSFATSVRLATPGVQSLTVAAPFLAPTTSSVAVAGAVTHFAVSNPATSPAGSTFALTVTALDATNAVGTGYTSAIHFTSSDALAGLPADYTFTAADLGTHTFAVTLKSSGARFLGVGEVAGSANGGSSIFVNPGQAQTFALAMSGGAIGVARPLTIVARDAFGNTDTSYNGTIHVSATDPAALLPPDTALVNGTTTVNVTLLTVGSQTITALDRISGLTGSVAGDATPPVAKLFAVNGPSSTTAGLANAITVTVRDTIGQVATGYTGTVYFTSSDVQAGLPASYTFTSADAGIHSFSATYRTAGSQSISVRDGSGSLTGSLIGIAVTPAAFSGYRLSVPLGTDSKGHYLLTAGDSIALTVRAVDAFGNTVGGYKGKAHFTSTDVLAGLPADYSFSAADAGSHTFAVALKTATANAQVWSFNVADTSSALTLSTLTNFEVTNAAAAKFTLSAPSNATTGVAITLKLTVTDAYGNKVKNYFGTVRLSSTAGNSGLPADYTFNALDAGVHTFTVTLTTAIDQTLTFIDLANPSLTSGSFIKVKSGTGGGGGGGGGKTV